MGIDVQDRAVAAWEGFYYPLKVSPGDFVATTEDDREKPVGDHRRDGVSEERLCCFEVGICADDIATVE